MVKKSKRNQKPRIDKFVDYMFPGWGLKRAQARAFLASYDAAQKKRGDKDHTGKDKGGGSGDDHIDHYDLWTLRETARDLDRNNGLAMAIVDRVMENVISSTGFELRPKTPDEDLNKQIKEDFSYWITHNLDACREFSGWSFLRNVFRSYKRDGDYFLQFRPEGNCSVMGFEGDRVLNPNGQSVGTIGGLETINGIAKKDGVKKFLWVANRAPKSPYVSVNDGKAIRADRVVQIYSPRRTTQGRGIPICAPLIREIDDIDDLLAWERQAAKIAASLNMVVKTENPVGAAEWMRTMYNKRDEDIDHLEELDPLALNYIRSGEEIQSVQSNRPNNTFESFIMLLNRYVGIPIGLPLELVLLDFSHVNFASSRQLLNQAQRRFEIEQDDFAWFLFKIYQFWLDVRIERGFYDRDKLGANPYKHVWGFPGWPSPNPLQDAQACALAIQYAFGSRTEFNRRRGISQEEIEQELERENVQLVERAIPVKDSIEPPSRRNQETKTNTQEAV
ncbi:phage portal protein [Gimesia aquarii]|uniref:Phage portal protein, lambda family n=1 Tax=Gimesia aquarii TaxID=2527964 RepID=A0A517VR92_9PLAN|nr:phage portal protein [Gimesia aquarii]QDT95544.1 Phage portal protein, lambda family [Gimesia aquarii]